MVGRSQVGRSSARPIRRAIASLFFFLSGARKQKLSAIVSLRNLNLQAFVPDEDTLLLILLLSLVKNWV